MAINSRSIGKEMELLACRYLQRQGLKLIVQNFSCRLGEIDLIMLDKSQLVFIEVRFRKNHHFGTPLETINFMKQQKLIKTAMFYLQKNQQAADAACRFDVIAISSHGESPQVEWVKNAFESTR